MGLGEKKLKTTSGASFSSSRKSKRPKSSSQKSRARAPQAQEPVTLEMIMQVMQSWFSVLEAKFDDRLAVLEAKCNDRLAVLEAKFDSYVSRFPPLPKAPSSFSQRFPPPPKAPSSFSQKSKVPTPQAQEPATLEMIMQVMQSWFSVLDDRLAILEAKFDDRLAVLEAKFHSYMSRFPPPSPSAD